MNVFAEKVRTKVEATPFLISAEGKTIQKTCSIGYAAFPFYEKQPDLLSFEKTLQLADMGLFYAKEHGRNRSVGVKSTANIPQTDQLDRLVSSFEYARKNDFITLAYEMKDGDDQT